MFCLLFFFWGVGLGEATTQRMAGVFRTILRVHQSSKFINDGIEFRSYVDNVFPVSRWFLHHVFLLPKVTA